jgi:nitrogen-specific signal transduction histidine kinase
MSEEIGAEIKDDLKKLNDQAIRVSKIVQYLLAFARKRKPEKSYVNINEILINTIALRAYDLGVNNIAVIEDIQTDLPKTIADPHQLQQVFFEPHHQCRICDEDDSRSWKIRDPNKTQFGKDFDQRLL